MRIQTSTPLKTSLLEWSLYVSVLSMPASTIVCNASLVLAALISFLIFIETRKFYKHLGILTLGFFLLFAFSVLYSKNFTRAISSFELFSSYLFIPLIIGFAGSVITIPFRNRLLLCFSLSVFLLCTISYVRIVILSGHLVPSNGGKNFTYYDPFSRYAFSDFLNIHPTYLSIYLLFALVIVFEKTPFKFIYKILLMGVLILFLLILSSKNQVIIIFAIISILIWKNIKVKPGLKIVIIAGVTALLILIGSTNDQIRYRFSDEITTTLGDRIILWSTGKTIIRENFIIGVGIGDREDEVNAVLKNNNHAELSNFNLHNQYLDFAMALGIIGFFFYLFLLIYPFTKKVELTFSLFILIIATSSLTESILYRQKGLVFFLLFYGLLGLPYRIKEDL